MRLKYMAQKRPPHFNLGGQVGPGVLLVEHGQGGHLGVPVGAEGGESVHRDPSMKFFHPSLMIMILMVGHDFDDHDF